MFTFFVELAKVVVNKFGVIFVRFFFLLLDVCFVRCCSSVDCGRFTCALLNFILSAICFLHCTKRLLLKVKLRLNFRLIRCSFFALVTSSSCFFLSLMASCSSLYSGLATSNA
jgi:hypothetical protein